jgi:hypothetical protein
MKTSDSGTLLAQGTGVNPSVETILIGTLAHLGSEKIQRFRGLIAKTDNATRKIRRFRKLERLHNLSPRSKSGAARPSVHRVDNSVVS